MAFFCVHFKELNCYDSFFRSEVHSKGCLDRLFLGESPCLRHGSITGTMEKTVN
jgi:hypothetical protein